jgi:hypothetical protein
LHAACAGLTPAACLALPDICSTTTAQLQTLNEAIVPQVPRDQALQHQALRHMAPAAGHCTAWQRSTAGAAACSPAAHWKDLLPRQAFCCCRAAALVLDVVEVAARCPVRHALLRCSVLRRLACSCIGRRCGHRRAQVSNFTAADYLPCCKHRS